MRVETGANSGAAKRHACQFLDARPSAPDGLLHLAGVAAKFLPQPDRCCVLQVGAARLDQWPELAALRLECRAQLLEGWEQLVLYRHRGRELNRGWDDVVGGLAQVDVVVWVHDLRAPRPAQNLVRSVGDDLVGIGVGRGPRAGLVDVDRELAIQGAFDHLLCGGGDGSRPPPGKQTELTVSLRGRLLDHPQCADEAPWKGLSGNRKVQDRPLSGGAVIGVGRNLHLAHRILFHAGPLLGGHAYEIVSLGKARGRSADGAPPVVRMPAGDWKVGRGGRPEYIRSG